MKLEIHTRRITHNKETMIYFLSEVLALNRVYLTYSSFSAYDVGSHFEW